MSGNIKIMAVILAIGAVFWFGWQTRGWKDQAALEAQEKQTEATMAAIQKAAVADSAAYEKKRAEAVTTIAKLNKQMESYRAKNPIPADCLIPADGVHAVAAAVKAGRAR